MRSSPAWTLPLLLVALSLASTAWARAPQRIIALELQRDFSLNKDRDRSLRRALHQALVQAQLEIVDSRQTARHFKPRDPCVSISCLQKAAEKLDARYVIGGRISREGTPSPGSWTVALWLFDARARATVSTAQRGCQGCEFQQALAVIQPALTQLIGEAEGATPARLKVSSRPPGAAVTINGRPVGVTDMSFTVSPGPQRVVFELSGYQTHNVTVEVPAGKEVMINAELKTARQSPVSAAASQAPDRAGVYGDLKWVLAGGALAALPAGVIFLALGSPAETQDDQQREEATVNNFTPVGIALTVTGAVLATGAVVSLLLERRAYRAALSPRVEASGAGLTLGLGGRF